MIGTRLGAYEIQAELGRGGMAIVYRAYQPSVGRDVAIKIIQQNLSGDQQAIQRFQREAKLIARLEHPHILPIYDFDGAHQPPYIVMRYLDSGTLRDILAQGLLPLTEIGSLFRQITSALDYAHRQAIVHRDIKPSNILIDRDGNAFVSDLGIARLMARDGDTEPITETGAVIGTADYMAPEQGLGQDVDLRTDIYALGVLLFQMVTGKMPFHASNSLALLHLHLEAPVPSVCHLRPELPEAMDALIQRAMAKQAADRFTSAAEFNAELTAVLGSEPRTTSQLRAAANSSIIRRVASQAPTVRFAPEQQNKLVTALCANAAEYAELVADSDGSEIAREAMIRLWNALETVITDRHGMIVTKSDSEILALWGVETTREDDTAQAIYAALAMQARLRTLGGRRLLDISDTTDTIDTADKSDVAIMSDVTDASDTPLISIGIHSGSALLTPDTKTGAFTASGATISLANRLMHNADGTILISQDVFRQVFGIFDLQPGDALKVRGRKDSVATYHVLAARSRAFRAARPGIEGVETRLIGRETELRQLQNAFLDAIEDREIQVVTMSGEAGVGKSRLLFEFDQWADLRPEQYFIFRGWATAGAEQPYALIRELMSFRFEILDNDPPAVVMHKLEEGITDLIGANPEMAHLIGYLCGFDFADSPYVKGLLDDAPQLTRRARQLFVRFFSELARQQPILMELEDLHHADDASLDLLNGLFNADGSLTEPRTGRDRPLIVIGLARPALYEQRPTWGSGQEFHRRIDLKPLDKREARALVGELLQKVVDVPKSLRDLLVERAEGNPYFLEELVKTLIDERVIVKDSDTIWHVEESRLGVLSVPSTLRGLLEARFDTLLHSEKLTLQRASVFGRIFYDTALAALNAVDETHVGDLTGVLAKLTDGGFIDKRETTAFQGSVEYSFVSGLLRDAIYSALLTRQLTTYHAAAAEWLNEAAGVRAGEYAPQIAEHYERSGNIGRAGAVLTDAGEQAMNLSVYATAQRVLERALKLLPGDVRAYRLLAQIHFYSGDYEAAKHRIIQARALANTDSERAQTLDWLATITKATDGNLQAALELRQEALQFAQRAAQNSGDWRTLGQVLASMAEIYSRLGQHTEVEKYAAEALALARKSGDTTVELRTLNYLSISATAQKRPDEQRRLQEERLSLARRVGNRLAELAALNNLGVAADVQGDLPLAYDWFQQTLAVAREMGVASIVVLALLNLAENNEKQGRLALARQQIREGLTLSRKRGDLVNTLYGLIVFARLVAAEGDKTHALALLNLVRHHPGVESELLRNVDEALAAWHLTAETIETGAAAGEPLDFEATLDEVVGPVQRQN